MGVIFRPATLGAVRARRYANWIASALRGSGLKTARRIIDGCILVAEYSGKNIVVRAVTMESLFVSFNQWNYGGGLAIGSATRLDSGIVREALQGAYVEPAGGVPVAVEDKVPLTYLGGSWVVVGGGYGSPNTGTIGPAMPCGLAGPTAPLLVFNRTGSLGAELFRDVVIRRYRASVSLLPVDATSPEIAAAYDNGTEESTPASVAGYIVGMSAWSPPKPYLGVGGLLPLAVEWAGDHGAAVVDLRGVDPDWNPLNAGHVAIGCVWFDAELGETPATATVHARSFEGDLLPEELRSSGGAEEWVRPADVFATAIGTVAGDAVEDEVPDRLLALVDSTAYSSVTVPGDPDPIEELFTIYGLSVWGWTKAGAVSTVRVHRFNSYPGNLDDLVHRRALSCSHMRLGTTDRFFVCGRDDLYEVAGVVKQQRFAGTPDEAALGTLDLLFEELIAPDGSVVTISAPGFFVPRGMPQDGSTWGDVATIAGRTGRRSYGFYKTDQTRNFVAAAYGQDLLAVLLVPEADFLLPTWHYQVGVFNVDGELLSVSPPIEFADGVNAISWLYMVSLTCLADAEFSDEEGLVHGVLLLSLDRYSPSTSLGFYRGAYVLTEGGSAAARLMQSAGDAVERFSRLVCLGDPLGPIRSRSAALG